MRVRQMTMIVLCAAKPALSVVAKNTLTCTVADSTLVVVKVVLSKQAIRALRRLPKHIVSALLLWKDAVETHGLAEVRKVPGYHDEPLKGDRKGQRSIRLSKSYRAVYEIRSDGSVEFVSVEEVSNHYGD